MYPHKLLKVRDDKGEYLRVASKQVPIELFFFFIFQGLWNSGDDIYAFEKNVFEDMVGIMKDKHASCEKGKKQVAWLPYIDQTLLHYCCLPMVIWGIWWNEYRYAFIVSFENSVLLFKPRLKIYWELIRQYGRGGSKPIEILAAIVFALDLKCWDSFEIFAEHEWIVLDALCDILYLVGRNIIQMLSNDWLDLVVINGIVDCGCICDEKVGCWAYSRWKGYNRSDTYCHICFHFWAKCLYWSVCRYLYLFEIVRSFRNVINVCATVWNYRRQIQLIILFQAKLGQI